jgi:hypothetical protein
MKLRICVIALGLALLVLTFNQESLGGSSKAYPSKKYTPGQIATTNIGVLMADYGGKTFSQVSRKTTQADKRKAYENYDIPYPQAYGAYEADHFIPLALGGADALSNLWPQPLNVVIGNENWGYRQKDLLESYLIREVKSERMPVVEAQECIKKDWIKCYREHISFDNLGSLFPIHDPDDELD